MPWIVKLDKDEDFIGKGRSSTPPSIERNRVVGFTLPDGEPDQGAAVLDARGSRSGRHERATRASWAGHRHGVGAGRWPATAPRSISDEPGAAREVLTKPFYNPTARCCAVTLRVLEPSGPLSRPMEVRRSRRAIEARRLERRRHHPGA
jgi:hypothetical protein